mmetsp:Transcript_18062/g.63453  ORF Transcript_18062/g.63453 Transcript_18062/m.63453 type:complete len:215 (+) Transcript_18062:2161-2805(+)
MRSSVDGLDDLTRASFNDEKLVANLTFYDDRLALLEGPGPQLADEPQKILIVDHVARQQWHLVQEAASQLLSHGGDHIGDVRAGHGHLVHPAKVPMRVHLDLPVQAAEGAQSRRWPRAPRRRCHLQLEGRLLLGLHRQGGTEELWQERDLCELTPDVQGPGSCSEARPRRRRRREGRRLGAIEPARAQAAAHAAGAGRRQGREHAEAALRLRAG